MITYGIVLTLEMLEGLFEGKRMVLEVGAIGVRLAVEIDPAELAISKDMIEKAMLLHMHAPPSVN